MQEAIVGAGGLFGGGGGGGSESANTLRSRSWYNVLLFVSEGTLAGLSNGDKIERRIFLNGTPIESQDGTINYRGVTVAYRNGAAGQTPIPVATGFSGAVSNSVGQKISTAVGAVTRTYTNAEADGALITLSTPGLRAKDGNNIVGSYVKFRIDIANGAGAFSTYLEDAFDGKTTGYSRDYKIKLPPSGPWRIRITRLTPDVPAAKAQDTTNDLIWDKTTLIFDEKLSYPNTALIFMRFDSAFFQSEPTISIKSKPMMLLVPNNYDAATKTYTGSWTGNFKLAATNNPAWVAYNLLINKRWGLGSKITPELVDKWSFYQFGTYCDTRVANGQGVMEPRHTFAQYVRNQADAVKSINSMLESCRAGIYESGGQLTLLYDRADRPMGKPFTNSNVLTKYNAQGRLEESGFAYECSHINDLPSAINAKWYDPDNFDKPDYVRVTLQDVGLPQLRDRYGDRELDIDLPWCRDIDEARRHARYKLASAHLEQWTVNFSVDEVGMLRQPGELIPIQDNQTNTTWLGGKIKSAAVGQIELDRPVVIDAIGTVLFDDNGTTRDLTITNPISITPTTTLNCAVTIANMPEVGSEWLLNLATNQTQIYRIIGISNPEEGKYRILAREYVEQKYAVADAGKSIKLSKQFFEKPLPPSKLFVYYDPNFTHVGWLASPSKAISQYVLEYQNFTTGVWQPVYINPNFTDYSLPPTSSPYSIRVAAVGNNRRLSDWVYTSAGTQTSGLITARNLDGSVTLDKPVFLDSDNEYWIIANAYGGSIGSGDGLAGFRLTSRKVSFQKRGQANTIRSITRYTRQGVVTEIDSGYLGVIEWFYGPTQVDLTEFSLNNQISSLTVSGGSITVYDGLFAGVSQVFAPGTYNLAAATAGAIGNDRASSISVPAGAAVYCTQNVPGDNPSAGSPWTLTKQVDSGMLASVFAGYDRLLLDKAIVVPARRYLILGDLGGLFYKLVPNAAPSNTVLIDTGITRICTSDTNLVGLPIDNNTVYVRVAGGSVTVYADANYTGVSQILGVGFHSLAAYPIGINAVSSVRVPAGASIRLTQLPQETVPLGALVAWNLAEY